MWIHCWTSWNPWIWMRLDLMFAMRDIYTNFNLAPLLKLSSSSRIIKLKYNLQWNMSQLITKTVPIKTTIAISCVVKKLNPLWVWRTFSKDKSHAKGSHPLHELQDHVYELHNPFKLMEVTRHRKIAEMSWFIKV